MVIGSCAVAPTESITRTTKGKVPAVKGVPESEPVELSVTPGGSDPDSKVYATMPVPPEACRMVAYG